MSKPKKVRGSAALKALAFLLAWVLAVGICVSSGVALRLYITNERYQNGEYSSEEVYTQAQELPLYLFLYLHRSALTVEGKSSYEELGSEFSRTKTNFRYAIYDDSDNVVMSNSAGQPLLEQEHVETMGELYYDGYGLGYNRMISYYVDVQNTYDWEVCFGTPQQWSLTENTSAYYYNEDAVLLADDETEEAAKEAAYASRTAVSALSGEGVEYYDFNISEDDLEPETDDSYTEDVTTYCYFVYTGSFPGYRIEYGVDLSYPVSDIYSEYAAEGVSFQQTYNTTMPVVLGVGITCLAAFALLLTYLTLAIGWNREGELALRGLNRLPIEVVLAGA